MCRCASKRLLAQRRERQHVDRLAALTALIAGLDASVTTERVEAVAAQIAPGWSMQLRLMGLIVADPAVLTAGGSRMPKVVADFLYAAISAGITGLTSPSCALCHRPKTLFHTHAGQRICQDCYNRSHTATCSVCGRDRRVNARTADGAPVCPRCQANTHQGECDGCGRTRTLKRSVIDQRRYCRACRARRTPTEICVICGRDRRVNARDGDGGAICSTCYTRRRVGEQVCDQCGQLAPLHARAGGRGGHSVNLCAGCYTNPRRECGICGRTRRVSVKATASAPDVCPTCHQWPVIDCSVCGRTEPGRRTTNHGQPMCFRCDATAKIDTILTDASGVIPAPLKPVRDAIADRDRPRSILSNLTRTASLALLAGIAQGRIELTHDALDERGRGFSITYLRSVLVATGALPPRDEHLARLERFTTGLLADIADPADRALLARYARWHVIGRATPDRHGHLSANVADRCRGDIRAARQFLDHLNAHGQSTLACTQPTLDTWLATGTRRASFIRWLQRDGHLTAVALPDPPPPTSPGAFNAEDERWATVRRMLHDPGSASIEDRAAACLLLLYAQPAAKIAALTTDDITTDQAGRTYLRLGPEPLLLIAPLDTLITALPLAKPFGTAQVLADHRWLFPGKKAGEHIHPASLIRRLQQLGITTRTSRNTALRHLAATTPPAVFASLIGISTGAAVRWAELAGNNWTTYPAARRAGRRR
ncbi:Site-specific recombinase XerD [Jiangella alkaliphila]|uniref:Site-specific recombinase XerD n=2 Tax=Jiangella alkaliphila TaxID=419479 RepID=A0A1H2GMR1_9ACTN|nr:Site-specific recombinase XerD [Jiangella alkaliphila]